MVGPGIGSARPKFAWSSVWQKYWLRNSSCRQTICAPFRAASPMPAIAFCRFSSGSVLQRICTRPSVTDRVELAMGEKIGARRGPAGRCAERSAITSAPGEPSRCGHAVGAILYATGGTVGFSERRNRSCGVASFGWSA